MVQKHFAEALTLTGIVSVTSRYYDNNSQTDRENDMGTPGPPATVPTPGQNYTVQPGDYLSEIAQEAYGTEDGSFAGSDASIQLIYKAIKM